MIKAEVQQQLNELKASLGDALKTMKGQVAEVEMCLQQRLQRLLVLKRNTSEITTTA